MSQQFPSLPDLAPEAIFYANSGCVFLDGKWQRPPEPSFPDGVRGRMVAELIGRGFELEREIGTSGPVTVVGFRQA